MKTTKPLVSILIPAYNAENWIADTIRSALAQTWQHTEIIVVDDGSTDRTFEIARQFEVSGIRCLHQENRGAAAARNTAFSASRGDYIQWLDADDLLSPEKIARQLGFLLQTGPDPRTLATSAWGTFRYRPRRARFVPNPLWCDLSPAEFLVRKLQYKVCMADSTWLVSRELTEAAGPWDNSLAYDDDGEYFCRVLLRSNGVRFVAGAPVYYRLVGTSRLSYIGKSNRKLEALWCSIQLHMRYLRSLEDSDEVRAACLTCLQDYLVYYYPRRLDIVEQMCQAAEDLGGQLKPTKLRGKYAWIRPLFGWGCAQYAQNCLPNMKASFLRQWDWVLFLLETRRTKGKSVLTWPN
jgi:glycosyltransferase involved in cell wall biosynthesis